MEYKEFRPEPGTTESTESKEFTPRDYSTFEKGSLLLEMARRDKGVAKTLLKGKPEEKRKLFAQVGLSEGEVVEALELVNQSFGTDLRPVFW